jgi:hypothetical protein
LEAAWPVRYKVRGVDGAWASDLTVEPTSLPRFFRTVRVLGGAWEEFSNEKERRWRELGVREINVVEAERGDPQLRAAVRERLAGPGVLVIDELGIGGGRVRADVAALSADSWVGVEVKGERDTLARLGRQVEVYSQVFDICELVVAEEHVGAADKIPSWWGLRIVGAGGERVERVGAQGPEVSALVRAQLLWRDEALDALRAAGGGRGMSKSARGYIWEALAETLELRELSEVVRTALGAREGWLADSGRGRVNARLVG